jgi:phage terminase large subunit
LEDYAVHDRVAMVACKGPGKSAVLAGIGWHFLTTNIQPKVIATSITGDNLKDGLWTEFALWQSRSPLLQELFDWNSERISLKEAPETWWASARTWPKDADKSAQANAIAGLHADCILFLLDEMAEYPEGVVAAAEAALAVGKNCKIVGAGNPTTVQGPLYRVATKDNALWRVHHITGDPDSPDRAPRVSKEWAKAQREQWGADSNFYRVNVLGEFPLSGQSNLIDVSVVRKAFEVAILESDIRNDPKVLGVDCARFGDDRSVLFPRQGRAAFVPTVYREISLMDLVGRIMNFSMKWEPEAIFVDQTGLGAGVVDRLRELGAPVIGVEFGARAMRRGAKNKRVEMWWSMRDWLNLGGCLPNLPELVAELTGPTYRFDSTGAMLLESKADMKARGVMSPDLADALALTFAQPVMSRTLSSSLTSRKMQRDWDYDPIFTDREEKWEQPRVS